jgi:hypothetical protein
LLGGLREAAALGDARKDAQMVDAVDGIVRDLRIV